MRPPDLPSVFTRAQARDLGLSDVRLAGLVSRGYLLRLRRGVYARADQGGSRERYLTASTAALSEQRSAHALSHLSAVALWELPLPLGPADTAHLTKTSGAARSRRVSGLVVHHADSSVTDVTELAGIPVTTAGRTVADCLRTFGPRISVPIADAALHRKLTSIDEIVVQLEMQCHWSGRPRSDQSLDIVDGRRESWLESYAFVRFVEWGVDLPEPQVGVFDGADDFVARVDGGWLEDGTVLELDGKSKYLLPTYEPGAGSVQQPGSPVVTASHHLPDSHCCEFRGVTDPEIDSNGRLEGESGQRSGRWSSSASSAASSESGSTAPCASRLAS